MSFEWILDFDVRTPGSSVFGPGAREGHAASGGATGYIEVTPSGKARWVDYATGVGGAAPVGWDSTPVEVVLNPKLGVNDEDLFWKSLLVTAGLWLAGFAIGKFASIAIAGKPIAPASILGSPVQTLSAAFNTGIAASISGGAQIASASLWLFGGEDPDWDWITLLGGVAAGSYGLAAAHYAGLPGNWVPPELGLASVASAVSDVVRPVFPGVSALIDVASSAVSLWPRTGALIGVDFGAETLAYPFY